MLGQNTPAGVALANGQFAPGKVTIRHQFVDFTGTYVLHCHILAHEDRGMMQLVRVVSTKRYPKDCQQAIEGCWREGRAKVNITLDGE